MIARNITELIGHTPLLQLNGYCRAAGLDGAQILVKLESFNPGGSVKDRAALSMIEDAEKSGRLLPGGTIIEPTSGNTGIGLAMVGRSRGYRVVLTMPESMSIERRKLLKQLGAELVLTPAKAGMAGAIAEAEKLQHEIAGAMIAGQFDNPANPAAHIARTGPEIWEDTEGRIAAFVAGVGSGGTITGVGKYLKSCNSNVRIVAVEPAESAVLEGAKPGVHGIQGIGAGFIPGNYSSEAVDEVMACPTKEAVATSRMLAVTEGVLAGISSGAALWAATQIARRPDWHDKMIVALLPDTGERYLSTVLFE